MSKGLNNYQIDEFFEEEENDDLKKNYMGTYSIDSITKYINFYEIIKKRNANYPFAIFNTDKHNEPGQHWWSFLDINPKTNLFLFDSFGLEGFKLFIVDNDQDIINKLLYNFEKCKLNPKIHKLQLCAMQFWVLTWKALNQKIKSQLTETAQNFSHLLEQFAKLKKTNCMSIMILENTIQDIETSNCGQFQLYLYENLFDPDNESKILNHRKLTKQTLQTIINEIFSTDIKENEYHMKKFSEEFNL